MADFAEIAEGQVQGPPEAAPRTSSRGKSPVSQRPSKTVSDSRSAAQTKTTKKRKGSSPKSRKNKRNKFTRRYSASSSSSESSDASSSSDSDSDVSDVSSRPTCREIRLFLSSLNLTTALSLLRPMLPFRAFLSLPAEI